MVENTRRPVTEWTEQQAEQFWEWNRSRPGWLAHSFAAQQAPAIVNFVRETGRLHGTALDVSCGPGHIAGELLRAGLSVYAADVTRNFAADLERRYHGDPNWHGAVTLADLPSAYAPNSFGVITCVELFAHVPEQKLRPLMAAMRELLTATGILVVVTALKEDLEQGMVYCPFCRSEFHRQQHGRSETEDSLRELLEGSGFDLEYLRRTDLGRFNPNFLPADWGDWNFATLYDAYLLLRRTVRDKLSPRPYPRGRAFLHRAEAAGQFLCAIARPASRP
jgi:SAM-dependent methyltransferase